MIPLYMKVPIDIKCEFDFCYPTRAHESDAGADLCAKENTLLHGKCRTLVRTGVKVAIPIGYVGLLFPRSSLSKLGITMTNSVGVIDSSYRGEIMASLMYNSEHNYMLEKATRIVQLVVLPITLPTFKVVEELNNTERGEGGFGSSG
jgi:dUTP pyrophosphatase